jgi:hypothetical protein
VQYNFMKSNNPGNFVDLSSNGLINCYDSVESTAEKAAELIERPYLKEEWAAKSADFLKDKIDTTSFLAGFIESFA